MARDAGTGEAPAGWGEETVPLHAAGHRSSAEEDQRRRIELVVGSDRGRAFRPGPRTAAAAALTLLAVLLVAAASGLGGSGGGETAEVSRAAGDGPWRSAELSASGHGKRRQST